MDKLVLKSPAKINLFLEVLKKRDDGYHEIVSLIQAVDLCDELVLEKRKKGVVVTCDHPDCPTDESNLAFKAASMLLEEETTKEGVSIHIKKKIPISAGLGGGSSNAAATLKGINRLFELELPDKKLHDLASRIGSDVPFFLYSGQALVKGRGEKIVPINMYKDYWLILVCPHFEVSTRWAYQNVKISLTKTGKGVNFRNLENQSMFFKALRSFRNDLEEVVSKRYPVIQKIKEILKNAGALKSSMSGSGPTVYGVFERKPQAEEVTRKLLRGDWFAESIGQIFLTQPIPGNT
ncbi:MAG: 4-(cytidine 5'-diphospho)-2-C-methyl-D-erythritol kinase [candidate division Zixibacteria bacterium]|nr:4-(cytidine 5'-diphospho)-2-C-methyl-D-erythritol kinase [candidate division Zixibacteria bacterium]